MTMKGQGRGAPQSVPPQSQATQPGREGEMRPEPLFDDPAYRGSGKLSSRVALISGGDSGIGRAVAVAFAKEGAHVAVLYLNEHEDARITRQAVERYDRECLLIAGDVGDEGFCRAAIEQTVGHFKRLDVLVNNAAEQHDATDLRDISAQQLERVFRTNIFSCFFLSKAALPHLKPGSAIVNTTSVTAYRGSSHLIDYASTKGAIVAFTRSLAVALADKGIRVNGVAPGPIWTPLIPASFPAERTARFGQDVLLGRPGQPAEVAPSFVFLASNDSVYMTGQVLHPNGGEIINT